MKIVVVGGVAAGMSCAARARRLDEFAEIVVFERAKHVSFANCGLPYHIGEVIKDRGRLLLQLLELRRQGVVFRLQLFRRARPAATIIRADPRAIEA